MAEHVVRLPLLEFADVLTGVRFHVIVPVADVGDVIVATEVAADGVDTGRTCYGAVQSVTNTAIGAVASVRWSMSSRRPSSTSRRAVVVPCRCGHVRTLHEDDGAGRCTLCGCLVFSAPTP